MKRWWIMAFIIPSPFLIAGLFSLNLEQFNYSGIDNLTIAVIMFIGYGLGVFLALMNYDKAGMLSKESKEKLMVNQE